MSHQVVDSDISPINGGKKIMGYEGISPFEEKKAMGYFTKNHWYIP